MSVFLSFLAGYTTPQESLARVVQRLDNAIHRINHYPADSVVCFVNIIHWIVIYPLDSVIQPLNNRGQLLEIKSGLSKGSLLFSVVVVVKQVSQHRFFLHS